MPAPAAELDPLRLTRCIRCGYPLDGLAEAGACPECGLDYDQTMVVFYGDARGHAATGATGPWHKLFFYGCVTVLYLVWGWKGMQRFPQMETFAIGALFLLTFVPMLIWRISARRIAGGSLTQCRFNAYGALQSDTPDETTGAYYPRRWRYILMIALCLLFSLVEREWIFLAIAATAFPLVLLSYRRRSRATEALIQTSSDARRLMTSARNGWGEAAAIQWAAIETVSLAPIRSRPTRRRLKVIRSTRWKDIPIDAEVDCTASQEAALHRRIADWQRAVRLSRIEELGEKYARGISR
jgi:hypothetical protein